MGPYLEKRRSRSDWRVSKSKLPQKTGLIVAPRTHHPRVHRHSPQRREQQEENGPAVGGRRADESSREAASGSERAGGRG
jgi:hypothetical protein